MTSSIIFAGNKLGSCKMPALRARPTRAVQVLAVGGRFDVKLRPYTLRKGDTLQTIAKKRGLSVEQLVSLNQDIKPDLITEGQTILLPGNRLSSRDKEILDGIGISKVRLYPVRSGESVDDIASKRKISMEQMKQLNPGINLNNLQEGQVLQLPADKYTVREREMLLGSGILPPEFFAAARNPFVIGFGALMAVCGFVLAWQQFYKEEDADDDDE